jgi:hypothetical protein
MRVQNLDSIGVEGKILNLQVLGTRCLANKIVDLCASIGATDRNG